MSAKGTDMEHPPFIVYYQFNFAKRKGGVSHHGPFICKLTMQLHPNIKMTYDNSFYCCGQ